MENSVFITAKFDSNDLRDKTLEFLNEETRPIIDDLVDEPYRDMFNAIDCLEYPHYAKPSEDDGVVEFILPFGEDFSEDMMFIFKSFKVAGAKQIVSVIWCTEGIVARCRFNGSQNHWDNDFKLRDKYEQFILEGDVDGLFDRMRDVLNLI